MTASELPAGPLAAVDVGNSGLRARLFELRDGTFVSAEPRFSIRRTTDDRSAAAATVARVIEWNSAACVVGAVHGDGEWVAAELRQADCPTTLYRRGDEFPLQTDVTCAAEVGVDRLAAARAGWSQRRRDAFIVDLGTAITVDWIDKLGVFKGGAILAGRRLRLDALRRWTDRLPALDPTGVEERPPFPGRSTREAILGGMDAGLTDEIDGLLDRLNVAAGREADIWVAGGDAPWFAARTRHRVEAHPDLVLNGLVGAWLESCGGDCSPVVDPSPASPSAASTPKRARESG